MRRPAAILLAAITTPILMTGLGAPAAAEPTAEPTAVPDCVLTDVNDDGASDYVVVTNACRHSVRVQVVLDNYPDEDCVTIAPTKSRGFDWLYPGHYAGLRRC